MADILCAICGEPWDIHGVRHHVDMDTSEAKKFLRGEGCPACGFGTHCRACRGSGKERCWWCYGAGRVGRGVCFVCGGAGHTDDPCPICGGTGKPPKTAGGRLAALESEVEASDEDPVVIMHRRGLSL